VQACALVTAYNNQLLNNAVDGTFDNAVNPSGSALDTKLEIILDTDDNGYVIYHYCELCLTNQLLINASNGTFDDAVDLHCSALSTYYVAIADKINDHDLLDIVIGNTFNQNNQLLINASDGTFYFNDTVDLPCGFLNTES
jgi:hypothetical protein